MLPIVIIAVVAVPILVLAFMSSRKSAQAAEHPAGETSAERARTEHEFEDAEAYEAQWRRENPTDQTRL